MKKMTGLMIGSVLAVGLGCGGNDIGSDLSHECVYEESTLSWAETSPDGAVIEDLLTMAEVTIEGAEAEYAAIDGESLVDFEITRRGEQAYYYEGDCGNRLELPMTVKFKTLDATDFDEVWEVRAVAGHGGDSLDISHRFELEDLNGTYAPEPEDEEGRVHAHTFSMEISDSEKVGTIYMHVETEGDDWVSESIEPTWTWTW